MGLRKQTLGGHKQKPVLTRTQEKGDMTTKKTDQDLPVCVQESSAEAWVSSGLLQVRGIQCISACMGLLKNVAIIFITWTIVWPQVKKQGGNTAFPPPPQKIGLKIY